jgi:hypothetical protein
VYECVEEVSERQRQRKRGREGEREMKTPTSFITLSPISLYLSLCRSPVARSTFRNEDDVALAEGELVIGLCDVIADRRASSRVRAHRRDRKRRRKQREREREKREKRESEEKQRDRDRDREGNWKIG